MNAKRLIFHKQIFQGRFVIYANDSFGTLVDIMWSFNVMLQNIPTAG